MLASPAGQGGNICSGVYFLRPEKMDGRAGRLLTCQAHLLAHCGGEDTQFVQGNLPGPDPTTADPENI